MDESILKETNDSIFKMQNKMKYVYVYSFFQFRQRFSDFKNKANSLLGKDFFLKDTL